MTSGIYGIFQGNRVYIGQSVNIEKRWRVHKTLLKLNKHHCQFLQRVSHKYGSSSLQFNILEVCSASELDNLETQVWEGYEARGFTMMNSKPEGGVLRGENHHRFGGTHTEEARAKMREAKLGENHPFFGKTHTDEAKKKMSKSHEKFSFIILHVATGNRYETTNLEQWCKDFRVYPNHLSQTFDGPRKTSQGYKIVSKVEL
jgi:group I intron endonuclease